MCGQENADYAFIVDASGSILSEEFLKLKQFIKGVVDYLSIGPELTHVGLIEYSRSAKMQFSFTQSFDKAEIKQLVDNVPHTAGITRIDLALKVASEQLFTSEGGMRPTARKVNIYYYLFECLHGIVLHLVLKPLHVELPLLPNLKILFWCNCNFRA